MNEYIAITSLFVTVGLAILSLSIPVYNTSGLMIRLYCLINISTEIIGRILSHYYISNIFLYHILIWLEVPILLKYFTNESERFKKHYYKILGCIYVVMAFTYIILEARQGLGTYSRFIESLVVIGLCLIYYNEELKNPKVDFIQKDSHFWYATGFLFYFGGSLFVSLVVRYYLNSDVTAYRYIWSIQNVLDIVKNLIIAYGLLWYRWAVKF